MACAKWRYEYLINKNMLSVIRFFAEQPLLLASQSPRRKQLLTEMDIPVEIVVSHADESYSKDLTPHAIVQKIAEMKAQAVAKWHPQRWILAADTTVVVHNELLEKPKNREEAIQFLTRLSGGTHEVMTAFCLYHPHALQTKVVSTRVTFRTMTHSEMEYYIDTYKPYDKAGGYGIQEWIGLVFIEQIEGSYSNVVGLPTAQVATLLTEEIKRWHSLL
jgi:septum formation protein